MAKPHRVESLEVTLRQRSLSIYRGIYVEGKKKYTLCCTPKTDTVLYVKYISKNINE